jgi:hypothetical protein
MSKTSKRLLVSALFCAVLITLGVLLTAPGLDPKRELHGQFLQNHKFIIGVNYPWLNYGTDFGANAWGHRGLSEPISRDVVDADFAYLAAHEVSFVRYFVLCDGRAGLVYGADGTVLGVDNQFFQDMDSLVQLASKHGIYLVLVVLDYSMFKPAYKVSGVPAGGHSDFVLDPARRKAFLERVFKPILLRYGHNGNVVAWEVINEPEWVMDMRGGRGTKPPIPVDVMKDFVKECTQYIHSNTEQAATIGSAYRRWVELWTGLGLDFYQIHYYPWMESAYPLNYDAQSINVDKPVIIGEYPTVNGVWPIENYLRLGFKNRYAGMLAWAVRSQDKYSNYFLRADQVLQWRKDHAQELK